MSTEGQKRGKYLFWTDAMVDYLEYHWPKKTGKAIAKALTTRRRQVSPAAVSGKAHYMGLQRKTMVGRPPTRKRKPRRVA